METIIGRTFSEFFHFADEDLERIMSCSFIWVGKG